MGLAHRHGPTGAGSRASLSSGALDSGFRYPHDLATWALSHATVKVNAFHSWLEIYANLQSPKTPKSISDKVPYRSVTNNS
ncbi:hypothetical protein TNCV_2095571 [Trichonephila clavipes]|nr:hypothetical protein TNCV_2095571 [Trichonephila clavipes]